MSKGQGRGDPRKKQLQNRARELISGKPDGICGGHLTQLLREADDDAVWAVYGKGGQALQRGWLQNLLWDLGDLDIENRGRDFMYTMKDGGGYTPTPISVSQPKTVGQMAPQEFLGDWMDSLGNAVTVLPNAHDSSFTVILARPPRRDVVLAMTSTDMGGGWRGWSCGNSVLNLMHSSSVQLYWEDYTKGRMSCWMRFPSAGQAQVAPEVKQAASHDKPKEQKAKERQKKGKAASPSKPEEKAVAVVKPADQEEPATNQKNSSSSPEEVDTPAVSAE